MMQDAESTPGIAFAQTNSFIILSIRRVYGMQKIKLCSAINAKGCARYAINHIAHNANNNNSLRPCFCALLQQV